ncbi:MAG: hypothetical protein ACYTFD_16025 [Planctomycetota bacterium]|jgi:hypothetical protein
MRKIAAVLAFAGIAVFAQDKFTLRENKSRTEFAGKIVCIGCHLQRRDGGADSQCTLHTKHAQGLVTEDGWLWTFVDNTKGHHLITTKKLLGKEIKVLGWTFPKSKYIEVSKYQIKKGDEWVAYDYCKVCGFEPGDNNDTDLCEECQEE